MAAICRKPPLQPPQTTISPPSTTHRKNSFPPTMAAISSFSLPSAFLFTLLILHRATSEPTQDKQSLISFISKIHQSSRIQWNTSSSVCSWIGVTCDSTNSSVIYIRLPGAGLVGTIPPDTIGKLTQLRVLSLRSNGISGDIPTDFSNLIFLRSLYLQDNLLSGEFPASLTELTRLTRLDLSGNYLSGALPFSINNMTQLAGLLLQNNDFFGELPSITQKSLVDFNISNNKLNGSIPMSLSRFPESAFSGNINLCGKPLPPCNKTVSHPPSPGSAPALSSIELLPLKKNSKNLSKGAIIAIAIGSALILVFLLLLLLLNLRRKRKQQIKQSPKPQFPVAVPSAVNSREITESGTGTGTSSSKDELIGGSITGEKNKLTFLTVGIYSFDLEDLLRASAEVLGKGGGGTSYKAVLEDGTTVVVKRLKDVTVTEKEFETQMEVLSKINNENVVPLIAYYYSKDEKLLVSDFMPAGSLSALLHGSRGLDRTPLGWDHRVKIATSAAKGVAHLHVAMNIIHGNIKSSNIILHQSTSNKPIYASVSDYGLNSLIIGPSPTTPNHRVSGYRAPEVTETQKITYKSDVYSFGVLLLELLTGKSPNEASLGEEGIDLPRWVQSVVREEWTAEVFDAELMTFNNIEEEMVQMLQIAMSCVSSVPDQRPAMQEVVKMMEEMKRAESDNLPHNVTP